MIACKDFDPHPQLYITTMHAASIISPPVNLFTIYCILCKSTKPMSTFKWYLFLYQTSSTIFDFIYTTVALPVIFFPLPMGYTGSWIAEQFSVSAHTAFLMVIPSFPCVATCIFSLFAYRIHLIIPHNHILRINENGNVYATVVFFFVYIIPTIVGLVDTSLDQTEAKQWILSIYSCAKSVTTVPRIHIYTPDSTRRLIIIIVTLVLMAIPMALFIFGCSLYFLNKRNHLSKRTKKLQRRFLIFLCIQISIPAAALATPILTVVFLLTTAIMSLRVLGYVALVTIGLHGVISSLSVIFCNEPYRQFTLDLFIYKWKPKRQQQIRVSFSVDSSKHEVQRTP